MNNDYADDEINEFHVDENYIPNSFVDEEGIRHAVVWDADIEIRYEWNPEEKTFNEVSVF